MPHHFAGGVGGFSATDTDTSADRDPTTDAAIEACGANCMVLRVDAATPATEPGSFEDTVIAVRVNDLVEIQLNPHWPPE